MTPEELKARTKDFALRIIRLAGGLPRNLIAEVIGRQILRSGTSVGANYRSALRARSRSEFTAKLAVAREEADETLYWLELLAESGLVRADRLKALAEEANQLVAIFTAARKSTARATNQSLPTTHPKIVNRIS